MFPLTGPLLSWVFFSLLLFPGAVTVLTTLVRPPFVSPPTSPDGTPPLSRSEETETRHPGVDTRRRMCPQGGRGIRRRSRDGPPLLTCESDCIRRGRSHELGGPRPCTGLSFRSPSTHWPTYVVGTLCDCGGTGESSILLPPQMKIHTKDISLKHVQ